MDGPRDQMCALLDGGLYDSAQMLGCFLASSSATNIEVNPYAKADNLVIDGCCLCGFRLVHEGQDSGITRSLGLLRSSVHSSKFQVLLGDAFLGQREFRRSLSVYRQALQQCKISPKQNALNVRNSLSTNSFNASINENEVKFKISQCYCSLNENRAALTEMEGIPNKARTLQMNLMLGKLYRIARHNRSAIACYKECLRNCPFVMEAITALAELGVSSKDILSFLPQTPSRGKVPFDHFDAARWLQKYAEAQCCIACNDYRGGLDHFSDLLQRFPCNIHIFLEIAKVEAIIGRSDDAIVNFDKARSIDPYVITYMDEYAMLLKAKSDHSKLNKVVHDLLNIDPARAEVFVALSVLWERKDERRALAYVEKSLKIDERHIAGHVMKGNLLLSLRRPDAAVAAFRSAQELRSDLRSYQGLVRSYLALSKTKEALYAAREAMKAMPQSAKALKLVGDVHASNPTGREKARKFFESSLRLEPDFLGAALALAELHVAEGRIKDAVSLLERYLKDWADDSLHVKLAQVFAVTNMLSEALSHYQAALRINPQNEAAKKGLERLEKQMKGMDPDAPEDDEDNEVDDAEGDQEEAELI